RLNSKIPVKRSTPVSFNRLLGGSFPSTGLASQPLFDGRARLLFETLLLRSQVERRAALHACHGIIRARFRNRSLEPRAAALRALQRELHLSHVRCRLTDRA